MPRAVMPCSASALSRPYSARPGVMPASHRIAGTLRPTPARNRALCGPMTDTGRGPLRRQSRTSVSPGRARVNPSNQAAISSAVRPDTGAVPA